MQKNFSDTHKSFKLSQQALIFNNKNEVLVLRNSYAPDQWLFPGGRVDADEVNLKAALAREIKEEVNLELAEIYKMIWFDLSPGGSTYAVLFEVKVKSLDGFKLSHEHNEYRWINPANPEFLELMFYKNLAKKVNEIYTK